MTKLKPSAPKEKVHESKRSKSITPKALVGYSLTRACKTCEEKSKRAYKFSLQNGRKLERWDFWTTSNTPGVDLTISNWKSEEKF